MAKTMSGSRLTGKQEGTELRPARRRYAQKKDPKSEKRRGFRGLASTNRFMSPPGL
jgi:hypothetical protein